MPLQAQSPRPLEKVDMEQPKRAFDNTPVYGASPQAFEKAGEKAFENKDFYAAMRYFKNVLLVKENDTKVLMKYAESARLYGAYEVALDAYRQVVGQDTDKTYPNAIYWLAMMEKMRGQYDPAYQYFQQFVSSNAADTSLLRSAKAEIETCIWAMEVMSHPDDAVTLERLPDEVNTGQSEFGAAMRGDTLFYATFKDINWKDKYYPERPIIKVMEKTEKGTQNFASFNHPTRHTAHTAFSPDGEWMVYNLCDYTGVVEMRCELMMSKKYDTQWLTGVKLPDMINYPGFTATQPNIGRDLDGSLVLYFVSDRPGGVGGLDIWKAKFTAEGLFSAPENLKDLNTPADDVTPFFNINTNSLYFSTQGRRSLGGFDIYKSAIIDGKYGEPQHLEAPFNSSYHDIYYAMQGDDLAFFSSNRAGSTPLSADACCYDIYMAQYLTLNLESLAFSKLSGDPLNEVLFTVTEKFNSNPPKVRFSGDTNQAEFEANRNREYRIIASKEGYRPDTIYIRTDELPLDRKFVGKLYLEPTDFALNVRTFNQFYKSPLPGVKIKLIEMKDKVPAKEKDEKNTENSNETDLAVRLETQYMIIGNKEGFFPDTVMVVAGELKPGMKMTKNLFLTPSSLNNFLPLALYFDNDQPDPRTRKESTLIAYDQTYERYIARRETFIREFTAGMSEEKKAAATAQLNQFFTEDVMDGFSKLDNFSKNLGLFLETGYRVEIMVKGFASPLANNEYNMALTKRRIASVLNYFRKAEGGIFNPFMISGQLAVTNAPFGETAAAPGINDSPRNRRESVYSVAASKERRAEILEIRLVRQFKN